MQKLTLLGVCHGRVEEATRECTSLHVTLAISYGARQDIVAAAQQLVRLGAQGDLLAHQVRG